LKNRFVGGLGLLWIESAGLPRRKGHPSIATRWGWRDPAGETHPAPGRAMTAPRPASQT
jgi:hypothetical protein